MASGRCLWLVTAIVSSTGVACADPGGTYHVAGVATETGAQYEGTVEVTPTGQAYSVHWKIASDEFRGIAIASGDGPSGPTRLAVAFGSTESYGILDLSLQPDGSWSGHWVYAGGEILSAETWSNGNRAKTRSTSTGNQAPRPASKPQQAP